MPLQFPDATSVTSNFRATDTTIRLLRYAFLTLAGLCMFSALAVTGLLPALLLGVAALVAAAAAPKPAPRFSYDLDPTAVAELLSTRDAATAMFSDTRPDLPASESMSAAEVVAVIVSQYEHNRQVSRSDATRGNQLPLGVDAIVDLARQGRKFGFRLVSTNTSGPTVEHAASLLLHASGLGPFLSACPPDSREHVLRTALGLSDALQQDTRAVVSNAPSAEDVFQSATLSCS